MSLRVIGLGAMFCLAIAAPSIQAAEATSTGAAVNSDAAVAGERQQAQVDMAVAPIKSESELASYIAAHRSGSPLDALPSSDRQAFLGSLKFNENGLTEFRYDVLGTLTPTQAYMLLALFGQQRFTPALPNLKSSGKSDDTIMATPMLEPPLTGYRCEERGTCVENQTRACTSNC